MGKKAKSMYIRKRTIKTFDGKYTSIHISPKDMNHFKVPKTNLEHIRPQFFEYLGALVGRASHTKTNGYLIRRLVPKHNDLEGRYIKLHKKLFGKEPRSQLKPDGSHDIRVNSKATYEYFINIWGFNPKATTPHEVLAKPAIEHLLKMENRRDRRAFLIGFFNTHLKTRYSSQQSLKFMFYFTHQNPRVSELVTSLCAKEGIKLAGKGRKRYITSKDSKLRALNLFENPYEQARLVTITAEKKGFGEKQFPEKVAARLKKADLKNINPELIQTGLLETVEKRLHKGLFGKITYKEKQEFRTKIEGAGIAAKLKLKQIKKEQTKKKKERERRMKKRSDKKTEKERKVLPSPSKRMISSKGKPVDPEHQVKIIQTFLNKKNHNIVNTHLKMIDNNREVIARIEKYARTYHPEKTRVIQALEKYQESR